MFDTVAVSEAHALSFPSPVIVGEDNLLDLGMGEDNKVWPRRVGQVISPGGIRSRGGRWVDTDGAGPAADIAAG